MFRLLSSRKNANCFLSLPSCLKIQQASFSLWSRSFNGKTRKRNVFYLTFRPGSHSRHQAKKMRGLNQLQPFLVGSNAQTDLVSLWLHFKRSWLMIALTQKQAMKADLSCSTWTLSKVLWKTTRRIFICLAMCSKVFKSGQSKWLIWTKTVNRNR